MLETGTYVSLPITDLAVLWMTLELLQHCSYVNCNEDNQEVNTVYARCLTSERTVVLCWKSSGHTLKNSQKKTQRYLKFNDKNECEWWFWASWEKKCFQRAITEFLELHAIMSGLILFFRRECMGMLFKIKGKLSDPVMFIKDAREGFRQDSSAVTVLLFGIPAPFSWEKNLKCCGFDGKN